MSAYFYPIKMAILIFPFLALLISLPIFAYAYHKNGAFSKFRGLVIYTFIFYLLAAYFLVILPLPSRDYVAQLTTPRYNLHPLIFIQQFIATNTWHPLNIHTYRQGLLEPAIIQPLFNIVLTLPFGVYLRYFGRSWKRVLIYTFCLSLFFELTQLSGLYGIYPRPYRLFDVDDLLLNTLGGLVGYVIAPIILALFPTHAQIKIREEQAGARVSYTRRLVALILDWLSLQIFNGILLLLVGLSHIKITTQVTMLSFTLLILVVFWLIPLFNQGATLGKRIVRLRVQGLNGQKANAWQLFWRVFWQYLVPIPGFITAMALLNGMLSTGYLNPRDVDRFWLLIGVILGAGALLALHMIINIIRRNPRLYYDYIAKTMVVSSFKA
ncbi:MAG: VanZ family protein [Lactobacillus sp.]|nr:VanZ family protein [Lactobacillus sp.]